jgi:hypothetical protein
VLVRFAFVTWMPTVEEIVQSLAPRASVKPVGAEPNFEMFPRSLVAAAVPVPLVVPPALSTVIEIELSTVPVTVNEELLVAAKAVVDIATATNRAKERNLLSRTRFS